MRIGGVGNIYPTFIYNPNTVSARSMDKLSRISDDVLDKKVDYSEMEAQENQNPLRKGQTVDFEGILAKQMQQGQNRAARIMAGGAKNADETVKQTAYAFGKQTEDISAATGNTVMRTDAASKDTGKGTEAVSGNAAKGADTMAKNRIGVMQMQRAMEAYGMFMTA